MMDRVAGDALIGHYRQHESLFAKTDAKDRHVAAAAVAARKRAEADIVRIITWNIGDFDRKELAKVGVVAETPDAFLCRLIADSPEDIIAAFVGMQDSLRHPRKTTRECVDTLAAQGLKKFAGMISARIE